MNASSYKPAANVLPALDYFLRSVLKEGYMWEGITGDGLTFHQGPAPTQTAIWRLSNCFQET